VFSCQAILVALGLLFLAQQYEHDGMFLDINSIPDTLNATQVDTRVVVGEGASKTAYPLKNRPFLPVISAVFSSGVSL
jgi:hypothetical protein